MKNFNIYHQVANMHCKHIDSGFLSTLGITFLTIMYEAIDKDKDSVLIVKTNNEKVIGYVAGTSGLGNIYLNLLKKPFSLFMALAPSLFSYTKIKKIIEILLINKKKTTYTFPKHELLTIVVDPSFRGKNVAEDLFLSLCEYFKKINVKNFKIIVGINLDRAHSFYMKMGCIKAGETQVHKGADSFIYIKECN